MMTQTAQPCKNQAHVCAPIRIGVCGLEPIMFENQPILTRQHHQCAPRSLVALHVVGVCASLKVFRLCLGLDVTLLRVMC